MVYSDGTSGKETYVSRDSVVLNGDSPGGPPDNNRVEDRNDPAWNINGIDKPKPGDDDTKPIPVPAGLADETSPGGAREKIENYREPGWWQGRTAIKVAAFFCGGCALGASVGLFGKSLGLLQENTAQGTAGGIKTVGEALGGLVKPEETINHEKVELMQSEIEQSENLEVAQRTYSAHSDPNNLSSYVYTFRRWQSILPVVPEEIKLSVYYEAEAEYKYKANIKDGLFLEVQEGDDGDMLYVYVPDPRLGDRLILREETEKYISGDTKKYAETADLFSKFNIFADEDRQTVRDRIEKKLDGMLQEDKARFMEQLDQDAASDEDFMFEARESLMETVLTEFVMPLDVPEDRVVLVQEWDKALKQEYQQQAQFFRLQRNARQAAPDGSLDDEETRQPEEETVRRSR